MQLIADSGSTKTDWRLVIDEHTIVPVSTIGFNPYFIDTTGIAAELNQKLLPELQKRANIIQVKEVWFYGAGCSLPEKCEVVKQAIAPLFNNAEVHIEHDLLGAARALCGKREGIAAILGTGSNSCYYDGNNVVANVPSNGYIFGDHGSGGHIGKTFLEYFLDDELPAELKRNFDQRLKITRNEIIDTVYRKPFPNRYLAGFSKFVFQNINNPFMVQLVADCFRQFFNKQVCKYPKYQQLPFNCVGSVGYYYNSILKSVAEEFGVTTGLILETPIAALSNYHRS